MKIKNKCVIAGCASSAFLFSSIANAGQITVTGVHTGTTGATSTGNVNTGLGYTTGNPGTDGYDATDSASTYVFNAPIITGGDGGAVTTTNVGGTAGSGLFINGPSQATINGGTYTGGIGGANTTGSRFIPGLGAYVLSGSVLINGGTFTGGEGFTGGSGAQDGFKFISGSVTILTGTFSGGTGPVNGANGHAFTTLGGTTNIYGGTFSSVTGAPALDVAGSAVINIYGSNFTLNGSPIGYGPIPSSAVSTTNGTIGGLLQDNAVQTSISYQLNAGAAQINLIAVPEPTSITMLIGGTAMALGRRRRISNRR